MKIILDEETQDMILSIERIDVDYHRVSLETSKEIVEFVSKMIPSMTPRSLSVIVRDIETEREFRDREHKHKTIKNWTKIENEAIDRLKKEYDVITITRGLYTDFVMNNSPKPIKYLEVEIPNFSRFLKGCFIYALGRSSYMVDTTVKYLKKYKNELNEEDRNFIKYEISKYVEKYKQEDENAPFHAFNSYIVKDWEKLGELL